MRLFGDGSRNNGRNRSISSSGKPASRACCLATSYSKISPQQHCSIRPLSRQHGFRCGFRGLESCCRLIHCRSRRTGIQSFTCDIHRTLVCPVSRIIVARKNIQIENVIANVTLNEKTWKAFARKPDVGDRRMVFLRCANVSLRRAARKDRRRL
jgi:hypothetical protein